MSDGTASNPKHPKYIDLTEFRAKLDLAEGAGGANGTGGAGGPVAAKGPRIWRSMEDLADTNAFRELVGREFPKAASEWDNDVSRRNFIKLMGASLALAGVGAGCGFRKAEHKILPYVQQPEQVVPGRPLFYASTYPFGGFGKGVIVEQHEGRPTKVDGNSDHPASLGGTDIFVQASILNLYDPDRSQVLTRNGEVNTWGNFINELAQLFTCEPGAAQAIAVEGGGGPISGAGSRGRRSGNPRVRLLTETVTSPTLIAQIEELGRQLGDRFRWHCFDPIGHDNARAGSTLAFGQELSPVYHFDKAKVVLSLDSNFFFDEPGSLAYAREFARKRRVRLDPENRGGNAPGGVTTQPSNPEASIGVAADFEAAAKETDAQRNRLYVVESTPTITGANADHVVRVAPELILAVARRLHAALAGGAGATTEPATQPAVGASAGLAAVKWLDVLIGELRANRGASLVVAGEYQPPEVHALAYALNAALGNVGQTVTFTKPVEARPNRGKTANQSLRELGDALTAGEVDLLLIIGANPVYSAPFDIEFGKALDAYKGVSVHMGSHEDETAQKCEWHIPETHYLEMWGDARAHDGTASIIQPLIAPLYPGARSGHELLAALIDSTTRSHPVTQQTIQPAIASPESEPGKSSGAPAAVPATQQTNIEPLAGPSGYDIVRGHWRRWKEQNGGGDFEVYWAGALVKGVLADTAKDFPAQQVQVRGDLAAALAAAATQPATTQAATTQRASTEPTTQPTTSTAEATAGASSAEASAAATAPAPAQGLTIVFRPDPSIWDGSFANNGWLQELPKQLLRTTWDNVAVVSPNTLKALQITKDDYEVDSNGAGSGLNGENPYPTRDNARMVNITYRNKSIDPEGKGLPLWVLPGHPDGVVTIHLGYGRTATSLRVGVRRGKSAYAVRPSDAPWFGPNAQLSDAGESYRVAVVQHHQVVAKDQNDLRDLVRFGDDSALALNLAQKKVDEAERTKRVRLSVLSIEEVEAEAQRGKKTEDEHSKLGGPVFPDDPHHSDSINPENPGHPGGHNREFPAWAMVIDQTACIGCNACVVACQSENNIAVVGYEQVIREREMHWIRIDTYYTSDEDATTAETPANTFFQPMPCMHCEKAPCELVCPVEATQHDMEGLNVMTYNRCVGTRYCSNNCPYKVRRFNFLQYADTTTPVLMLMNNPEVTVRNRGVMEKCTYCIQRISRGRIESKKAAARATDPNISPEHKAKLLQQSADAIEGIDTACAQACPTEAIVFGNMANQDSRVSRLKREPMNYGLLVDRGTQPRTTYLARVYNRNPEALKLERPNNGAMKAEG